MKLAIALPPTKEDRHCFYNLLSQQKTLISSKLWQTKKV